MPRASYGMDLLRAEPGLMAKVATELGLTRWAVVKWRDIPAHRIIDVERITGIPRERLRPELYAGRRCKQAAE